MFGVGLTATALAAGAATDDGATDRKSSGMCIWLARSSTSPATASAAFESFESEATESSMLPRGDCCGALKIAFRINGVDGGSLGFGATGATATGVMGAPRRKNV